MSAGPPPEDREKTLDRQIRAFHWVRLLAELPERFAGMAGEREAARRIDDWMRDVGLEDVRHTPVASKPTTGLVLGLHFAVAAVGCALGGAPGALLAVLAAGSFHRELRGRRRSLSALLPAPESCNVVGRAGAERPRRRIVLSAHMDTTRAGWIFSPRLADAFARRAQPDDGSPRPPSGPHRVPEALIWAGALLAVAAWLGAGGVLFGLARLLLGLLLLAGAAATLQWTFAKPSPGANDNASGVAAMLTCAEQLLADLPEDVELWAVATGAEEVGCCGMHAFVDAHADWPPDSTWYINFECVGGGALHWARSEGTLARSGYPPLLVELARRVAASGAFGPVTPTDLMAGTDGHVPADRAFPTLSLISLEERGVPRNYHTEADLPEALDMPTLVRAADFGAAVARAALRGEADPLALV